MDGFVAGPDLFVKEETGLVTARFISTKSKRRPLHGRPSSKAKTPVSSRQKTRQFVVMVAHCQVSSSEMVAPVLLLLPPLLCLLLLATALPWILLLLPHQDDARKQTRSAVPCAMRLTWGFTAAVLVCAAGWGDHAGHVRRAGERARGRGSEQQMIDELSFFQ